MASARELVTRRVASRARQFPAMSLHPLDVSSLEARDAALATAIDHAVARRWTTLTTVLEATLDRPWERVEPNLQAVLLVGAAQLLLLDRVPDHAAINEAVDLAKVLVRENAGRLVNAVLRRVAGMRHSTVDRADASRRDEVPLHDGRAIRLDRPVFASDSLPRLAGQTSHPEALLRHWGETFSRAEAARIARHDLVHPPIVITGAPADAGAGAVHERPGMHVYEGEARDLAGLLSRHPGARVQDWAATRPVAATGDLEPRVIIDACAGKGTKTRQLLALHRGARIVATDVDAQRLSILRKTVASHPQVEVVEFESLGGLAGAADLLVLDVPCSNTGVLARRVEAKYRYTSDTLSSLVDLQRQIVADTLTLLSPRGRLLYATCSLEPQENARQVEWICRWHGMRITASEILLPAGGPGESPSRYHDGGFFALLARGGSRPSG